MSLTDITGQFVSIPFGILNGKVSVTYSRYKHLAIEEAKPAPTEDELAAIETLLGCPLPNSFKDYLDVANGGYLDYIIDAPTGNGETEPLSFSRLFSTQEDTLGSRTFVSEIHAQRDHTEIPKCVLPFAEDGMGSVVFLDLTSDGNGRVIAFVKGLPEWAGLRTQSEFIVLASPFDDYIETLRIDRDAIIDNLKTYAKELSHIETTEEYLDIGMPKWREDTELFSVLSDMREHIVLSQ